MCVCVCVCSCASLCIHPQLGFKGAMSVPVNTSLIKLAKWKENTRGARWGEGPPKVLSWHSPSRANSCACT